MTLDCHRWVAAQSIFYHLYNQVSYMSLDQISPLTFSIGNTMKRISVIVSSIIIFHTPVQPVNALGAAIAILGTFIYSQVYSHIFLVKYEKFKIVVHIFPGDQMVYNWQKIFPPFGFVLPTWLYGDKRPAEQPFNLL